MKQTIKIIIKLINYLLFMNYNLILLFHIMKLHMVLIGRNQKRRSVLLFPSELPIIKYLLK